VESFSEALSIVRGALWDSSVFQEEIVDAPLLLLGLLFREVSRAIEVEPGEHTKYPQQLVDSPLGIQELNEIEEVINEVPLPLNE